jgi:hypothetical protein
MSVVIDRNVLQSGNQRSATKFLEGASLVALTSARETSENSSDRKNGESAWQYGRSKVLLTPTLRTGNV